MVAWTREDLIEMRDQLVQISLNDSNGTWDHQPSEVVKEARKLAFLWTAEDFQDDLDRATGGR